MIALIGAMPEEIAIIKEKIKNLEVKKIASSEFFIGEYNNKKIILTLSLPGKVNAAIATTILLNNFDIDYVINIGSAGALAKDVEIGDMIIATESHYFDVDATEFGYDLGQVPQMPKSYKSDEFLLKLASKINLPDNKIHFGKVATSDRFISDNNVKKEILKDFPTSKAVEMEAAAIAQTCYRFGVKFIVCRSISDKAEEKTRVVFDEFLKTAAINSTILATNLIEKL